MLSESENNNNNEASTDIWGKSQTCKVIVFTSFSQ